MTNKITNMADMTNMNETYTTNMADMINMTDLFARAPLIFLGMIPASTRVLSFFLTTGLIRSSGKRVLKIPD